MPRRTRTPLLHALLPLLLALPCVPVPGGAQTPRSVPASPAAEEVRLGDEAHTGLRPRDALAAFQAVLDDDPDHYGALWRASREAVTLGMLADTDRGAWYREAEAYGRRAVAAQPGGVEGWEWLSIALGRRALEQGPRQRIRLADEVRRTALHALELDPASAPAHHVLGEWHAEIKRLGSVTRWAAERLLGAEAFAEASWDSALEHLGRAVELEPRGLIHHLALARAYLDLERPEDARTHLRHVLERPAVEPTDPLHKQRAQELLGAR